MRREVREVVADWMIVLGALVLLLSLFLTWSHQFTKAFETQVGAAQLQGVPSDPTAWQVYSIADVLLALLAVVLVVAAAVAGRRARISALVAAAVGLAFTLHAMSVAPTNGANVSSGNPAHLLASTATSGAGEVLAVVALGLAIVGLALSFTAD
jgi:hypothetical protein